MRLSDLRKQHTDLKEKIQSGEVGVKGAERTEDPRFWYPKLDDKKVGQGKIRFLPASEAAFNAAGQGSVVLPWVVLHAHKFKTAAGAWFWENCPTSIQKECPICAANKEQWNLGGKANEDAVRGRSRKTTYYFNVLILSDPATPENVGKVKIYKCGKTVFEMLMDAAKPKFEGELSIDAFDLWDGHDFNLRIYPNSAGQIQYDKSAFDKDKRRVAPTDEGIEDIWKQAHDLSEFVAPNQFKSEEDLKTRFESAMGKKPKAEKESGSAPPPASKQKDPETPKSSAPPKEPEVPADAGSDLSYFESLVGDE